VSEVEILNFLKKSLGIIIKRLEEEGVVITANVLSLSAPEHMFLPEVIVDENGTYIDVNGAMAVKLKNLSNYPCFLNIDRPVSDEEYAVIPPQSMFLIGRKSSRIYLRAPIGHTCLIKVDALVS
jgi:hypothetical protein